jgi:hypothetical protein
VHFDFQNIYVLYCESFHYSGPMKSSSPSDDSTNPGTSHIKVKRSDGLTHDIVSVFKNPKEFFGLGTKPETISPKDQIDHFDHGVIKLHRSDGLNCDIIKVFKGMSDARGASMLPVKSRVMNDYLSNRTSMSKIEVQSSASKSAYTNNSAYALSGISNAPTSVRIIHMSNTHNHLNRSSSRKFLPDGDILIHSGGFTVDGTADEYAQFDSWLGSVKDIYHYRVVVAGLNDVRQCGNDWDFVRANLPNATHVLCHCEAAILGLRIYGNPWHWAHEPNYSVKQGAPSSTSGRFEDISAGVDVLVTHGPSFGKLDTPRIFSGSSKDGQGERIHSGSRELEEALRHVRPGLHLHGLCAESRGVVSAQGYSPLTINSCMCDPEAKAIYTCPHVIKCNLIYTVTSEKSKAGNHTWEFMLDSLI